MTNLRFPVLRYQLVGVSLQEAEDAARGAAAEATMGGERSPSKTHVVSHSIFLVGISCAIALEVDKRLISTENVS